MPPKLPRGGLAQATDPLAAAVAARMVGQLQGVAQLPGLSALSKVNIPAAYAGDQRSLQAVQRGISEAETGLPSPGRRKFMKQAAATAARSAVPESVANVLGTTALKKAVGDALSPEIPVESVQAAIASIIDKHLGDKKLLRKLRAWEDGPQTPVGQASIYGMLRESISPKAIAEYSGLPEEAIQKHIDDAGITPVDAFDAWINGSDELDAYMATPSRKWLRDYFDDPGNIDHPDLVAGWDKIRETGDEWDVINPWVDVLREQRLGPLEKLLGGKLEELSARHADRFTSPEAVFNAQIDAILDPDNGVMDDLVSGIYEGYN